jgi:hypothetical protein
MRELAAIDHVHAKVEKSYEALWLYKRTMKLVGRLETRLIGDSLKCT